MSQFDSAASEIGPRLKDYLETHGTIGVAYGVILEHTLAEKERSPTVVARCVALLKRYLLRSFNSQLSPANGKESLESKDKSVTSVSESPIAEEVG